MPILALFRSFFGPGRALIWKMPRALVGTEVSALIGTRKNHWWRRWSTFTKCIPHISLCTMRLAVSVTIIRLAVSVATNRLVVLVATIRLAVLVAIIRLAWSLISRYHQTGSISRYHQTGSSTPWQAPFVSQFLLPLAFLWFISTAVKNWPRPGRKGKFFRSGYRHTPGCALKFFWSCNWHTLGCALKFFCSCYWHTP